MLRRTLLQGLPLAALALPLAPQIALAQEIAGYPDRPVTIIVPFAAGGNTDAFARIVGERLDAAFGQRFVVENKAGAGGNLGVGQLVRSEPDGYTLGMGTVSTHAINPTLYKNLPYDPDTAFAPVSLFVTLPNVLAVNPKLEAQTVPELIELLKANPDKYGFASSGVGTSIHLAGEMLMARTARK
jgi:tripartite-type tricarboxylate transporter receptor subunit TctC